MVARTAFVSVAPQEHGHRAAFPAGGAVVCGLADLPEPVRSCIEQADRLFAGPEISLDATLPAGRRAMADERLRGMDFGRWAGCDMAEIGRSEPHAFACWCRDASDASHGGEPLTSFCDRVGGWLSSQLTSSGGTVVLAHPFVVRAAVLNVLGGPATAFSQIDVAPWRIVNFTSDRRRWAVRL